MTKFLLTLPHLNARSHYAEDETQSASTNKLISRSPRSHGRRRALSSSFLRTSTLAALAASACFSLPSKAEAAVTLSRLTCAKASAIGKSSDTCTVTLSGPAPAAGLKVTLSSSHKSYVTLPASVAVPGDATSVKFKANVDYVHTVDDSATLTASASGIHKTFTLKLLASTRVLNANTSTLSFGSLPINATQTLPLMLTSSGNLPVTISAVTLPASGFTVTGAKLPLTLNPGQATTLNTTFKPTGAGTSSGQIAISTNSNTGTATVLVRLTGKATSAKITVSTTKINFGSVNVGSTATQEVIVTSSGTAPVTISSAQLTGAGFDAGSSVSLPVTLYPGQTAIGYMTFAPTTAGTASATLNILSNSTTPSVLVALNGTGVSVTHSVNLSWDAPGSSPVPVTGYHIYRSTGGTSTYTLLSSSQSTQTSFTDSSVQNGQTYAYVVRSVDSAGDESPASNSTTAIIP